MTDYKYFDLQVNGYAGIDFNSIKLNEEEVYAACQKLEKDNVEGVFATLITDNFDQMINKISNLSRIIRNNNYIHSIIKGIHIEGPFLNPNDGYRGAHPKEHIIPVSVDKVKHMIDSGEGLVKIFTLAPELDHQFKATKLLSESNIIVSAGHSNASMDDLYGAIDNGLKLFTHLGNGSPSVLPRHDNIVNRVISLAGEITICFIADGIHIPVFALKNYIKAAGIENCIIVTDCMAAASAPPGIYSVSHINVEVGEDKVVREVGRENLAGSAITMKETNMLLKEKLNFDKDELEKVLYKNVKKLLNSST